MLIKYHQINRVGQAFKHEIVVCYENRIGLFQNTLAVARQSFFTATYLMPGIWVLKKSILKSSLKEEKFEDGKSLCSKVFLLSEHSPAEWNKCFNITWKTNSSNSNNEWTGS